MIAIRRVSNKICNILQGNSYKLIMYSDDGMDCIDPDLARRFFVADPGLMITLDEENQEIIFNKNKHTPLKVYKVLIDHCKNFANEYMFKFTISEFAEKITPKLFANQAKLKSQAKESALSEASLSKMFGSKKTSRQTLENVQLLIRHKKPVDDNVNGSRTRNISHIFIESSKGKFLFPHKNLLGARAMARHISFGGEMSDQIGEYILEHTANLNK